MKVKSMMVRVGADTRDMERGLSSAQKRIKAFRTSINQIGKRMAIAGAAVVGAVGLMVKSYIEAGDEVHKMALRTGFSTEALSELKYASEISGASLESLEKGVKKMSKTIMDAADGLATYVRAFDRIGLKAEELMELSPEEQFDRIARAIAKMESPTLRAATAQEIFGRAGTQLLPLFAAGEEGLEKLRKKAHELGIVFDQEAADKAAALTDALTTLKGAVRGISMGIAAELVPAITIFVEAMTDAMVDIKGDTKAMTTSILGFFKLIAQGVMGLQLAWGTFKVFVFKLGEEIARYFARLAFGIVILTGLAKKVGILSKTHEAAKRTLRDLVAVGMKYNESADETVEKMTDVLIMFEKLIENLDKADEGYKKMTEAVTKSVLPAARDLRDILYKTIYLLGKIPSVALPAARSLADVYEAMKPPPKISTAWEKLLSQIEKEVAWFSQSWDAMWGAIYENQMMRIDKEERRRTDALQSQDAKEKSAIDAWYAREAAKIEATIENETAKNEALAALEIEKAEKDAALAEETAKKQAALEKQIEKDRRIAMRKQAAAQKLTNLMAAIVNVARAITEALPNIPKAIAIGIMGAVQIVKIATTPLPSLAKGGMIEKEGIYRLHPGEEVRSAADVKAQPGTWNFSPTVNIYAKYLDDRTIDRAAEKIFARLQKEQERYG